MICKPKSIKHNSKKLVRTPWNNGPLPNPSHTPPKPKLRGHGPSQPLLLPVHRKCRGAAAATRRLILQSLEDHFGAVRLGRSRGSQEPFALEERQDPARSPTRNRDVWTERNSPVPAIFQMFSGSQAVSSLDLREEGVNEITGSRQSKVDPGRSP